MSRALLDEERELLQHVIRHGSRGYPIRRSGKRDWTWRWSTKVRWPGRPFTSYKAALASFERYLEVLFDDGRGRV